MGSFIGFVFIYREGCLWFLDREIDRFYVREIYNVGDLVVIGFEGSGWEGDV